MVDEVREETPPPIPWGGEAADALAAHRTTAMHHETRLTALAQLADDPSAPWEVRITWRINKTATPVAVELRSRTGHPVTGEVWRSVRVAECVDRSRHLLGWVAERKAKFLADRGRDAAPVKQTGAAIHQRPAKAGRPPRFGPDHYPEVARVYAAAVAAGSRTPVRDVAEHMERTHPGDDRYVGATRRGDTRAKGWVNRAKALELITGMVN